MFTPITCPYCFEEFQHDQFAFRSSVYIEDEFGTDEINISNEYRERYKVGMSENYKKFWREYGGMTTEESIYFERVGNEVLPYERPVITSDLIENYNLDADGFTDTAVDKFGNKLMRNDKVCPLCHNPIPPGYGKNPVKRIAIIGVTGSGKTVYISQLLKNMDDISRDCGLVSYKLSDHERAFVSNNKVERGVPLPKPTPEQSLSQPMFYDIKYSDRNRKITNTIVIYDIAGEVCENTKKMEKFAKFINYADGIIFLIDPKQAGITPDAKSEKSPKDIIETLTGSIGHKFKSGNKYNIPLAVCISKIDINNDLFSKTSALGQVEPVARNIKGMAERKFNGTTYNKLSSEIATLLGGTHESQPLMAALNIEFSTYNFFAMSALGCDVIKGENGSEPEKIPRPIRIEEPLLWMFKHFGYLESDVDIKLPNSIEVKKRITVKSKKLFKRTEEKFVPYKIETEEELDRALKDEKNYIIT